ncbi:MAG TPA: family 1 glycosylhydrolase [Candidatus Paceibacterota bacterium]
MSGEGHMRSEDQKEVKSMKFPEGFFWGAATASYQIEGGIENNDWAEAGRNAKVPPAGIAADSWNRFREDFDLARNLHQNAHRFSLEWARIEPEEGKFDSNAIEHYREVIRELKKRGLEPFVTIWHFTLPLWFSHQGGFLNPKAPEIFSRYCKHIIRELSNEAHFWMTINEPEVYASNGYLRGTWPPFRHNPLALIRVTNVLVKSHILAYKKMKAANAGIFIGIAKNNMDIEANWNPFFKIVAKFMNWFWNERFLDNTKDALDFIGLNHYIHKKFGVSHKEEATDIGWPIFPKGIYNCLSKLKKYRKPIYITENGLADAKDIRRERYIKDYLRWVWWAIKEGADVRGYFYWSLIDNYEWAHGYAPRFGLVEVDYKTQKRTIRQSVIAYADTCKLNELKP